eukprot:1356545-Prymnesium_polylepis.1
MSPARNAARMARVRHTAAVLGPCRLPPAPMWQMRPDDPMSRCVAHVALSPAAKRSCVPSIGTS